MENSDCGLLQIVCGLKSANQENVDLGFSLLLILFSAVTYIYDTVTDVILVGVHYRDGNLTYFYLTLIFIVVPAVTITCFSLRFYLNDDKRFKNLGLPRASRLDWVIRGIFLVLQTGPVLRYLDSVRYGVKAFQGGPKQAFYQKKMACERNDASFLRLIECFAEAGPQLLLQLCIIVVQRDRIISGDLTRTEIVQLVSMFGSLISMSWALVAYQRTLRSVLSLSKKKKIPLSPVGTVVMFLWHTFEVSTRILALGLFASVFPVYFAVVCIVHFGVMLAWIISMKTTFCETRCEEIIYNIALAVVFLFCYFNPEDSQTRWRYLIYYVFILLENSVLMAVWYNYSDANTYKLAAVLIHFLGFLMGIMLMVIYYLLLHPTQNIHIFRHSPQEQCANCEVQEFTCDNANELQTAVHSAGSQEQRSNGVVKEVACDSAAGLETEVCSIDSPEVCTNYAVKKTSHASATGLETAV